MFENVTQTRKTMEQILEIGELFEKITKESFHIPIGKSRWKDTEGFENIYKGNFSLCINDVGRFIITDEFTELSRYVTYNIDDLMENAKLNDDALVKICEKLFYVTKKKCKENIRMKKKIKLMNGLLMKLSDTIQDLSEIESNE